MSEANLRERNQSNFGRVAVPVPRKVRSVLADLYIRPTPSVVLQLMPPLSLTADAFQHNALLTRSLVARSEPRRQILGSLLNYISSLTVIADFLRHVNTAVHWIHRNHTANTAKAQTELDLEYWSANAQKFQQKKENALYRALETLAKEKPILFTRGFILTEPEGSALREQYSRFLKEYNPQFYKYFHKLMNELPGERNVGRKEDGVESTDFEDIEISDLNDEVGGEYAQ